MSGQVTFASYRFEPATARLWTGEREIKLTPKAGSVLVNAACLMAKTRRQEEAPALLERVFSRGWGKRDWIANDPDYDSLRDEPRFQRLIAKLK